MIAFGVIVVYVAIALVIFTFALIVRRVLTEVKIPAVNGPLERTASAVIVSEEGSENRNREFLHSERRVKTWPR